MPCYDGREDDDRKDMQWRLDVTTRLACMYCKENPVPDWAAEWWRKHQLTDKYREDRARLNASAPESRTSPADPTQYSPEYLSWREKSIALNAAYERAYKGRLK